MASTTTEYSQLERSQNINSDVKTLQHVSPPHSGAGVDRLPDNGINDGSVTNISVVVAAVHSLCFDQNGDPV